MATMPTYYIIGRMPGYNEETDKDELFQNSLMHGLTIIDFIPTKFKDDVNNIGLSPEPEIVKSP